MWILYALVSALFYATANMFTKFSITKVVRDQMGIIAVHAIAAMVLITLVWLVRGQPGLVSQNDVMMAIVSGGLIGAGALFYFKAFNMADASMVTLLLQVMVPMTMLAGFIFLGDKIGPLQLLASAIILGGVVLATWSRKGFHLNSTKVIPVIIGATVITTSVLIISRSVVVNNDIIAFTFYQMVGLGIFGVLYTLFHPPTRKGFIKNMRPFHPRMLIVITTAEALYDLALLAQLKAFTYVNAGLVISVAASEVFISIILGLLLTKFLPHIISEKIDKKTLGRKFAAGVLITSGIVMLNFV